MVIGIIGATGLLGHHTAKAVQEAGYELVVIHRAQSDLSRISDLTFRSVIGDLNDPASLTAALRGLDYVMNCAAYYPTKPRPLEEEMQLAQTQMQHFIDVVAASGVKKALYLGGSIAIPKSSNQMGNEDARYNGPPPNKSPYVQTKWLMDKMALDAGAAGVPIVVGVPTMTFGEYDYGPSTGGFITQIANGKMPAYINGPRNMVYGGDAGRGLLLVCEKGNIGERYLITGENAWIRDLVTIIAEVTGAPRPEREISIGMARWLSRLMALRYSLFGGKRPRINSTTIAIMGSGQFFDGAKARALGYAPTHTLRQAVERAADWFKSVGYIKK